MTERDESAAVIEAEVARCRALVAADRAAMGALADEGFTYTHSTGRVDTRQSYLDALGVKMGYLDYAHRNVSVRFLGDVAIIAGDLDLTQKPVDGDPRPANFRFIGVWVKRPAGWKIAAHQNTKRAV